MAANENAEEFTFLELPIEILLMEIMPLLSREDVVALSQTCRYLFDLACDDSLWRECVPLYRDILHETVHLHVTSLLKVPPFSIDSKSSRHMTYRLIFNGNVWNHLNTVVKYNESSPLVTVRSSSSSSSSSSVGSPQPLSTASLSSPSSSSSSTFSPSSRSSRSGSNCVPATLMMSYLQNTLERPENHVAFPGRPHQKCALEVDFIHAAGGVVEARLPRGFLLGPFLSLVWEDPSLVSLTRVDRALTVVVDAMTEAVCASEAVLLANTLVNVGHRVDLAWRSPISLSATTFNNQEAEQLTLSTPSHSLLRVLTPIDERLMSQLSDVKRSSVLFSTLKIHLTSSERPEPASQQYALYKWAVDNEASGLDFIFLEAISRGYLIDRPLPLTSLPFTCARSTPYDRTIFVAPTNQTQSLHTFLTGVTKMTGRRKRDIPITIVNVNSYSPHRSQPRRHLFTFAWNEYRKRNKYGVGRWGASFVFASQGEAKRLAPARFHATQVILYFYSLPHDPIFERVLTLNSWAYLDLQLKIPSEELTGLFSMRLLLALHVPGVASDILVAPSLTPVMKYIFSSQDEIEKLTAQLQEAEAEALIDCFALTSIVRHTKLHELPDKLFKYLFKVLSAFTSLAKKNFKELVPDAPTPRPHSADARREMFVVLVMALHCERVLSVMGLSPWEKLESYMDCLEFDFTGVLPVFDRESTDQESCQCSGNS